MHYTLCVVWFLITIPTILWWPNSILWVIFVSHWANAWLHWDAAKSHLAAKAEEHTR